VSSRLEQRLAALAEMRPADLKGEWLKVLKSEPPKLTPDLMRLAIAYRLQERQLGAIPAKLRREVRSTGSRQFVSTMKPGTRLLRSWNGRSIEVIVTDTGFEHDGRSFKSLSQIAREVTGTAWSGPRFFGLGGNA
jgi:hypothetical protein